MPQRNYGREHTNVAKPNKRAILPIGLEEYQELSRDSARVRGWLDSMIETYPELFPVEIAEGYELHDTLPVLHNFWPYCPRARVRQRFISPAHKLNGFVYHDNWLHNLLISSSCAGLKTAHRIQ